MTTKKQDGRKNNGGRREGAGKKKSTSKKVDWTFKIDPDVKKQIRYAKYNPSAEVNALLKSIAEKINVKV